MKLLSLSLRYFRQHTSTEIQFADGLTAIIGSNGSGKTTLVEAIAFALYGSRVIRGKVEDVKTRDAPKGARTEVVLLFEQEGRNYRVERSLSEAKLFVGGEADPAVNGTREVNAFVGTLLGMDYGEFLSAFFTEQKGLEFLSGTKGAAERERFIVRMMGYDRLERAQELLRAERRDRRNQISGREAGLGSREDLENRRKAEELELKRIETDSEEAARSLTGAEARAQSAKKVFQALELKKTSYEKSAALLRETQVRLEERERRLKAIRDEASSLAPQGAGLEQESFPELLQMAQSRSAELEAQVRKFSEELAQAQGAFRDGLTRTRAAREEAQKRLSQALVRQKKYEDLDPESPCPTCGQSLGESFGHVRSEFSALLSDLKAEIDKHAELEKAVEVEPASLKELKETLNQAENDRGEALREVDRLKVLQQVLERSKRLEQEQTVLSAEIEKLNRALSEQRVLLEEFGFTVDEYAREKGAAQAAEHLEQVARLQKVRSDSEHEKQLAIISRTRQALDEYDGRVAEVNSAKQTLLVLEQSDVALTQFRKFLNSGIRPRLSELAGEFLADLTDGRYATIDIGADFSPTVLDENGPRAVISGGEQDILNLCMRLALSHMLVERSGQVISLLILDEVFGSLDENRRNNVLSLLEKLGNRFEQIIVITHFDDLKDAVQNIVYVDYDDAAGVLKLTDGLGESAGSLI